MNLARGLSNLIVALRALPSPNERTTLLAAWRIERALPEWFAALPLPELMQRLDAESASLPFALDAPRALQLADAAAVLDYFSPLGICLRRSLVRYILLRRIGLPVVVQFGAKKNTNDGRSRIAGHAWLTLGGQPYAEDPRDYEGFTPIYAYPQASVAATHDETPRRPSAPANPILSNQQSTFRNQ